MMSEPGEQTITPPPALGPPIIGTDPGSVAGIVQPVFKSGSATVPATPIAITGTPIIPPPIISDPVGYPVFPPTGSNTAPVAVPVGPLVGPAIVLGSGPSYTVPTYASGSGTAPTAASLFPSFTTTSPSPPIVFANIAMIGSAVPPSTPTTAPIIISTVPTIPQLPWVPPGYPTGAPINTVKPAITYTPPLQTGTVLTCSTGTWSNSPTSYAYEWLRNGDPIAGAHSSTYTLVAADNGTEISCVVTATNAAGEASAESPFIVNAVATEEELDEDQFDDNGGAQFHDTPAPRPRPKTSPRKRR